MPANLAFVLELTPNVKEFVVMALLLNKSNVI